MRGRKWAVTDAVAFLCLFARQFLGETHKVAPSLSLTHAPHPLIEERDGARKGRPLAPAVHVAAPRRQKIHRWDEQWAEGVWGLGVWPGKEGVGGVKTPEKETDGWKTQNLLTRGIT